MICPKLAFQKMIKMGLEANILIRVIGLMTLNRKSPPQDRKQSPVSFHPHSQLQFLVSTDQEKFLLYIMTLKFGNSYHVLSSLFLDQNSQFLYFFLKRTFYVKAVKITMCSFSQSRKKHHSDFFLNLLIWSYLEMNVLMKFHGHSLQIHNTDNLVLLPSTNHVSNMLIHIACDHLRISDFHIQQLLNHFVSVFCT